MNRDLRSIGTVLRYLIDLDLFARLQWDDLRRALKMLPVVKERIEFLRQSEIAELVAAAAKHDAALYEMTREEKAAGLDPATKRFKAITPFVKFVLLTGMRLNEAE